MLSYVNKSVLLVCYQFLSIVRYYNIGDYSTHKNSTVMSTEQDSAAAASSTVPVSCFYYNSTVLVK